MNACVGLVAAVPVRRPLPPQERARKRLFHGRTLPQSGTRGTCPQLYAAASSSMCPLCPWRRVE
eukprot:12100263-Prorocentrum_lima.AAC.1